MAIVARTRGAVRAAIRVRDRVREERRIAVAARDDAVRARVVVPGRDRRDRDDRRQALDAGRGRAVRERPVVRLPDHPGLAVVPGGDDLVAVLVVALPPTVQPVDADDGAQVVRRAARDGTARRVARADHVEQDDGVAARHEVVVVEERPAVEQAVAVLVLLELGLVAAAECRVVGARVHDDGRLEAEAGRGRPHDVEGDPILRAVQIGVEVRLHPDAFADCVGIAEHRLRDPVLDDDSRVGRRGCCGRRGYEHTEHRRSSRREPRCSTSPHPTLLFDPLAAARPDGAGQARAENNQRPPRVRWCRSRFRQPPIP